MASNNPALSRRNAAILRNYVLFSSGTAKKIARDINYLSIFLRQKKGEKDNNGVMGDLREYLGKNMTKGLTIRVSNRTDFLVAYFEELAIYMEVGKDDFSPIKRLLDHVSPTLSENEFKALRKLLWLDSAEFNYFPKKPVPQSADALTKENRQKLIEIWDILSSYEDSLNELLTGNSIHANAPFRVRKSLVEQEDARALIYEDLLEYAAENRRDLYSRLASANKSLNGAIEKRKEFLEKTRAAIEADKVFRTDATTKAALPDAANEFKSIVDAVYDLNAGIPYDDEQIAMQFSAKFGKRITSEHVGDLVRSVSNANAHEFGKVHVEEAAKKFSSALALDEHSKKKFSELMHRVADAPYPSAKQQHLTGAMDIGFRASAGKVN